MNLMDEFLNVEKKYGASKLIVKSFCYWSYCRFFIYNSIVKKLNNESEAHETLSVSIQISRYLSNLPLVIKQTVSMRKCDNSKHCLLVKCHSRRQLMPDKKYHSIYTDEILGGRNILNKFDFIQYESTYEYTHNRPTYSQNIVYLDLIEIICRIDYLINKIVNSEEYRTIKKEIILGIREPISELTDKFNVSVDIEAIAEKVVKYYYIVSWAKRHWQRILKKIDISAIIEVVHYDVMCMALNEVAHERGVPVIEMQHGMISRDHVAYQYADDFNKLVLPTHILTFSDFWSKQINLPCNKIATGFEYYNSQVRNQTVPADNDILFISQGNVSLQLVALAIETSDAIWKAGLKNQIYYKLHPSEISTAKNKHPELFVNDGIIVVANENSIYDLFKRVSIQIGYNSTALFEGMGLGIKTFVIPCNDSLISQMIEDGLIECIDSSDKIIDCIKSKNNKHSEKTDISDVLWAKDSQDKFNKVIMALLNSYK